MCHSSILQVTSLIRCYSQCKDFLPPPPHHHLDPHNLNQKMRYKDSIKETTPQNLPSAPPDGLVKALQALPKVQLPSSDLRKPDLSTRESDVDKFTKTSLSTNSGGSKKPQAMSKHGPPDATTIFSNQPSMSSVPPAH